MYTGAARAQETWIVICGSDVKVLNFNKESKKHNLSDFEFANMTICANEVRITKQHLLDPFVVR